MNRNFLSAEERKALLAQHRKEHDGRIKDRIKVVLHKDTGWCNRKIADALFIDEETVTKHFELYETNKKLAKESGGSSSKLNAQQSTKLIVHLRKYTYLHVKDIIAMVYKEFGVEYSIAGMNDWLKRNNFRYKKPKVIPTKVCPQKQEKFVEEYQELKATIGPNDVIIHVDAVHPEHQSKPRCGWIFKGDSKQLQTVAKPQRMNILAGLNLETMTVNRVEISKTIDSEQAIEFFKYLENIHQDKDKIYVVGDNAMYFRSKKAKEYLMNSKIIMKYLPPYSPNLNPIERVWKVMHEQTTYNRYHEKFEDFTKAIRSFFDDYLPREAKNLISKINDNFGIISKHNPLIQL